MQYGIFKGTNGLILNGTYEPALEVDVREGTQYGAGGTEFTGNYIATVPVGNCPPTRDSIYALVASMKSVVVECSEDVTGKTLEIVFEQLSSPADVAVVPDGQITKELNKVTFVLPAAVTEKEWNLQYTVRDVASKQAYAIGLTFVQYGALVA